MILQQKINKKFAPVFTENKRYVILMGGRGAGRSTFASQYANANLVGDKYFRCAIMRYILGDIRNSIYREIKDRAEENGITSSLDINESTMTISYGNNSINAVGFRKSTADQKSKLKSLANYNCIIIEEADEVSEEDFLQLDDSLRTVKGNITIILLLNPPSKSHWIIKRWFDLQPIENLADFYMPVLKPEYKNDTLFIQTSYLDNKLNIAEQSIINYERYKNTNPEHYWNMVRGYVPEVVKGKVYTNWKIIDEIPHEARLERYGLDFGYTNDPTSIVAVYYYNGGYILDEIEYSPGLTNPNIANILKNKPFAIIIADSSEPKSIDEIAEYKLTIMPTVKGSDSVRNGIQVVKSQKISVTRRSKNIITEYENYAWDVNKDGETLNQPKDKFNHAMDAIRYAITSIVKLPERSEQEERQLNKMRMNAVNQPVNSAR